jgi:hypothetical protein
MYNVHRYIFYFSMKENKTRISLNIMKESELSVTLVSMPSYSMYRPPQIKIITILSSHPSLDIDPYRKLISMFVLRESIVTVVNVIQKCGVGKQ